MTTSAIGLKMSFFPLTQFEKNVDISEIAFDFFALVNHQEWIILLTSIGIPSPQSFNTPKQSHSNVIHCNRFGWVCFRPVIELMLLVTQDTSENQPRRCKLTKWM